MAAFHLTGGAIQQPKTFKLCSGRDLKVSLAMRVPASHMEGTLNIDKTSDTTRLAPLAPLEGTMKAESEGSRLTGVVMLGGAAMCRYAP